MKILNDIFTIITPAGWDGRRGISPWTWATASPSCLFSGLWYYHDSQMSFIVNNLATLIRGRQVVTVDDLEPPENGWQVLSREHLVWEYEWCNSACQTEKWTKSFNLHFQVCSSKYASVRERRKVKSAGAATNPNLGRSKYSFQNGKSRYL